ncbi:MAG: fibronectin type III domain-containing protein [Actinobacteria bacterium]|nr:fibronectin type III domain-containing protein [Actinomycetota bacterium]
MKKLKKIALPAVVAVVAAVLSACQPAQNVVVTHTGTDYTVSWENPDCASEGSCDYFMGTLVWLGNSLGHPLGPPTCAVIAAGEPTCSFSVASLEPGDYTINVLANYDINSYKAMHNGATPPWDPSELHAEQSELQCFAPDDAEAYALDPNSYYRLGSWHPIKANCSFGSWTLAGSLTIQGNGSVVDTTPGTTPGTTSAPDAPSAVTATGGDAQATVAWTAPVNNGGADIDSYQVEAVGFQAGCQAQAPDTTCTVTGLPQNGKWSFTVTAHNSVGDSVPSDASNDVWTHDGCFQAWPEQSTIALGDSTVIHVWNALANKAVMVRVGGRKFTETADANGDVVMTYTADGSAGTANLVGKHVTVMPVDQRDNHRCRAGNFLYIPKLTMRAKFRQGGPIQALVRSIAPGSHVTFAVTDLADSTTNTVCEFDADDSGKVTCAGTADMAGNFSIAVFVDGVQMAGSTFAVTPKPVK